MLLAALGIADAGVPPPEAPPGVAQADSIRASPGTSEAVGLRVETLAVHSPPPLSLAKQPVAERRASPCKGRLGDGETAGGGE